MRSIFFCKSSSGDVVDKKEVWRAEEEQDKGKTGKQFVGQSPGVGYPGSCFIPDKFLTQY